jgi:hypothetical protein
MPWFLHRLQSPDFRKAGASSRDHESRRLALTSYWPLRGRSRSPDERLDFLEWPVFWKSPPNTEIALFNVARPTPDEVARIKTRLNCW